jgi:hypothetical protein
MTVLAKIGPIELSQAHEIVDPESDPGKVQISIKCKPEEAKQLAGLCQPTIRTDYGAIRVIKSRNNRWGVMPIESPVESGGVSPNEYTGILKGLVSLSNPQVYYINPRKSRVVMTGEMLSENHNEILSILYGKGGEDGSDIEHTFEDNDIEILLDDTFDGLWSDNWTGYDTYNLTSHNVSTSGGKLVFTGTNGTSGFIAPWGGMNIESKSRYAPPWEIEFDMEYVAGTDHNMSVYIVEALPHIWTDVTTHSSDTNYIRVYLYHHGGNLYYAVQKCVRGVISNLKPETALNISTEKNPSFKVGYYPGGGLEVYIDKAGGTNYTKIWGRANTGLNWSNPGLMYQFDNMSGASQTMRSRGFKLSVPTEAQYPNIVVAPPGAVCNETPTFTRTGEEGDIQCFKDPTVPLNYQITPTDFYKGSVKGMNGNYTDNVYRLITHNDMDLDPTKFYMSNGLIKLKTTANGVEYYNWNGTAYVLLNTFTLPNPINLIRPFYVSKDVFTLQLDRTLWTIRAGKRGIWIKHPNDALGFTKNTSCYHDGILHNGLADNADVSMLSQFYSLHFNPYNLLTTNMYGVEEGLDGFYDVSSTLEQVSGATYGTYHLKCTSKNLQAMEGVYIKEVSLPTGNNTGLIFGGRAYLKGTGTWKLLIIERKSNYTALNTTSSAPFTLTSTPSVHDIYHTVISSEAEKLNLMIYTDGQQSAEFYGDVFQLAPSPVANQAMYSIAPLTANRYGMLIMKKDPTIIKSDSIPASDITGIGVFDQMQPPISNDHYLQLAREWYKPTVQRLALQGVV